MASEESETQGNSDRAKPPSVMPKVEVKEGYRPLFEAAVKGDWKSAEEIINHDPEVFQAVLLEIEKEPEYFLGAGLFRVLDIALMARQYHLVKKLIKRVPTKDITWTLSFVLHSDAWEGSIIRTLELVDEKEDYDLGNCLLFIASQRTLRQKELIWYLATRIQSIPDYEIVSNLIWAGHLDIVLYLAKKYPELTDENMFEDFVKIKSYYRSGAQLNFWEKCIYQCIPSFVDTSFDNAKDTKMARGKIVHRMLRVVRFVNRIGELKLRHECWLELSNLVLKRMKDHKETPEILQSMSDIVLQATSGGIFEIVKLCLKQYPELMWDEKFAIQLNNKVVRARHVELYRLLNAFDTIQRLHNLMPEVLEWTPGNVPADVSGSAFLMQRELQWFEVLERRSIPSIQSMTFEMKVMKDDSDPSSSGLELEPAEKNRGKTCWEFFLEQRKDLLQEARQWMKDTSTSCSLVATLITTVAFAAGFTVPGGNDNTGIPIFLKKTSFMVFAIADALALFSSITATLIFLTILTSCYAAKDFLHALPRKMILGLTFLFLSLASMLVAFGSALTTVLSRRWEWIYIPITLLAAVPLILFTILQLPLYVEMVESTYRPRLYRPMKIWK